MSSLSYAARDSLTMLRRNVKHARRYPSMTVGVLMMPVVMLLLFVYVFGGAMSAGIGRGAYVDYVAPGILLIAAASAALTASVSVATDMTEGIINRFRTMAISRASVMTGHVAGCVLLTLASLVLVTGLAVAVGFRPDASPVEWLAAVGVLALITLALSWLGAAMGMTAKTVEAASNSPMPLQFLPMLGSAFVPTDTMPTGARLFAEYQPFTPVNETLRGLLTGSEIGGAGWTALGWGVGLSVVGYLRARSVFRRG
ncbi:ABC transporter permease [Streptomyces sp. NPDC051940]|uniref:ABC transporter permease n=1 Tax=Streptomyces sp. NPDC051940 TaxID=3155675 RepID=UPI0034126236